MFFPENIKNIKAEDRVLEVGPGSTPHPRANVFLEKEFPTADETFRQRGRVIQELGQKVIYYQGDRFPFKDGEFDYVICSHVIEHVDRLEVFFSELSRVANRGYVEFPTGLYDYIYDFPEHIQLLNYVDGSILWLPKIETSLSEFSPIQKVLFHSFEKGHQSLVADLKHLFFVGLEWTNAIPSRRVKSLKELFPTVPEIPWHPSVRIENEAVAEKLESVAEVTLDTCSKMPEPSSLKTRFQKWFRSKSN